ncbi:MAG TPA: DnaJ C-terminal domain-containing protein, partial [Clostridia bacterium]|nr:DnaJ C-terminal domain-containing protein [Clostridia bacterium]HUV72226.1 DnaJ C-terminal domain-containing protein [Clostridia bacterium]
SFPQAALGTIITVPTLDGELNLRVRPGTQPGSLVRLRGKGIRSPRSGATGDQYVRLQVTVPSRLSRKQKEILEQFEEE